MLNFASFPTSSFRLPNQDEAERHKAITSTAKKAEKLATELAKLDLDVLQSKADTLTNFGNAGHSYDCQLLKNHLLSYLGLFIEIAKTDVPQWNAEFITNKKPNDERGRALVKARMLKREFKVKGIKTHKNNLIIATFINLAENLLDPLTAGDVAKA